MEIRVDPKLFHDFHFKIAMSLNLPITSRRIIEEFVDIDVNTDAVAKILQRNQYFEHMLMHEIKTLGMKDNLPSLRAAIALLGMQRVRDFICALQILRMVGRRHPEIGKDGKFNFKPSELLTYATKTEEWVTNRRMQYPDTAYAAGMMFDVMVAVGRELFEAGKPYEEYVAEVYKHGLRTALIGQEIVKSFKNFAFSKFVFASCLIHDIGKCAMELLFPATTPNSYSAFRAELAKRPVARDVIHYIETKRFGLTHEYYGSQMAYYFQVFRSAEKSILFHHDPYLIKAQNKDIYHLACVIALASNMANHFRIPKDNRDPVYYAWFTPELRDFKFDQKQAQAAIMKLPREVF